MKKNKQYKVIASGREQEIGLIVKVGKEIEACPGYWRCQFVTGNAIEFIREGAVKPGWWTTFTAEELEEL